MSKEFDFYSIFLSLMRHITYDDNITLKYYKVLGDYNWFRGLSPPPICAYAYNI